MPKYNPLQGMGGGSGTGGRSVAKISAKVASKTAAKKAAKEAAKKAAKKETKKIASNSVKKVATDPSRASKFNQGSLMRTTDAATGAAARKGAAQLGVTGKKGVQPPVKINSAAKAAPTTKAGAKAIKAANKKVPTKRNFPKD